MPNRTNASFVPVSGVIFSRRLHSDAGCGRGAACHSPSIRPHDSFELCGSSEMAGRSWQPPCVPPQASNKKTPPREATARRGVVGARGGRRVTIHWAELRHAFIKGGGCRYDSRLWNPEIALSTLTSGHAICHAGRAGGSHLSSTFCAAPPATGKQHG